MISPDIIILIANIIIAISLIPSILSSDKPNYKTSVMQIIVSAFFIIAYIQLNLTFAILINFLIGLLWAILLLQWLSRSRLSAKKKEELIIRILKNIKN